MLVPGMPDTLGAILGIVDTIGKLSKKDDDYETHEVDRSPVIIQQPSQPSVPSRTDQVVNINLTLNFYDKDGKLVMSAKKDNV